MKFIKVKHVGKVELYGEAVIKNYIQKVAGSAWKKAGTDILLLRDAGYRHIIIRMNEDHLYKKELLQVAKAAADLIPDIKLEVISEV